MPQLPAFPSVFPVWWVAGTAVAGFVVSLAALAVWTRFDRSSTLTRLQAVVAAAVVGLSIFAWRLSGNIPELNDDPIGALSPNDWLCPVVTFVFLSVYAGLRPTANVVPSVRSLPTIVSFGVNVVTI